MVTVSMLMVVFLVVVTHLPAPTLSFCCEDGVDQCGGRCRCCDVPLSCNGRCSTSAGTGICKASCRSGEERLGNCPGGKCSCCGRKATTTAASATAATAATDDHNTDDESCPAPFMKIGCEYLYFHDSSKKNWDDALSHCKSIGGSLAEPANMHDFVARINSSYSHMKYDIWLGATDRSVEQNWKWLSGGSVPNYVWPSWPGNQPDGDGDCMQIHYHGYSGFFLNDYLCHVKGYFVCECKP